MQTSTTNNTLKNLITLITTLNILVFSNIALADTEQQIELALLDSTDTWQMNRLFEPTPKQVEKEHTGKIMIYDGLKDTTVAKALDDNFNRIENMMFTRVVVTNLSGNPDYDEFGNVIVEDDGCAD